MAFLRSGRGRTAPDTVSDEPLAEAATTTARQSEWLVKIVFVFCGVSWAVTLAVAAISVAVVQNWEPTPVFVRLGCSDDHYITFQPMSVGGDIRATVAEHLLAQYVEARESIDEHTEPERWKLVQALSSGDEAERFFSWMKIKNPDSPYKHFYEAKQNRDARTTRTSRLPGSTFQVEYVTKDYKRGTSDQVREQSWVATITVRYDAKRAKYDERFMNPFGVTVTDYTIGEKTKR